MAYSDFSWGYISLGYTCNHRCIICPNGNLEIRRRWAKDEESEPGNIAEWIDEIKKSHIRTITLSGGEPTLQKCFLEVLRRLANTDVRVNILSNGENFADAGLVEEVCGAFPRERLAVTTAFHAADDVLHDRISGQEGNQKKSIEGCWNLIHAGVPVQLKHCIHGMNAGEIEEFIDFLYRIFPPECLILLCGIDYVGISDDNLDLVRLPFSELGRAIERALDVVEEKAKCGDGRRAVVSETPFCIVDPYYWHYFDASGSKETDLYVAPGEGVSYQMNHAVESECGSYYKPCVGCRIEKSCPGAWKSAVEVLGDGELTPI